MSCDLSIIITNFNTGKFLRACLQSVFEDLAENGLRTEVIVVDDASTDGSAEMVADQFAQATLLINPVNEGYARSNNTGIRASSGDAVMLLNSDTIVLPGATSALFQKLVAHPDVAAVGPRLVNPDGSIQRSCWRFPLRSVLGNGLSLFRLGVWDDYRSWDHHADRTVDWIISAALMVRRTAFDEVGLLDERFWVYGVDVDWALRARRQGLRYLSLAVPQVMHYGRASWSGAIEQMSSDHLGWHDVLMRKHYGGLGLVLYRGTIFLSGVLRMCFWGIRYLLGDSQSRTKIAASRQLIRVGLSGSMGYRS